MSFYLNRAAAREQLLHSYKPSSRMPLLRALITCGVAPLILVSPLAARAHAAQGQAAAPSSTASADAAVTAPTSVSPVAASATTLSDNNGLPQGVSANLSNDEELLAGTTAQEFTLQQSVDTSLNTPLTALRLRLIHDEAFRELQVARANLDPQVRLLTQVNVSDSGTFANNNDPISSNDAFRFGAEATYPLLNHGSTIDQLHIAQENLIAADAGVVTQRRSIVNATIATFYDLVAAQRDVHNRDLSVQALQEQLQSAQARYTLGTVTKGDVLQAQSALDSAIAGQSSSQLSLQQFRATFAAVLGKDPAVVSPIALEPEEAPALGQSTTGVVQATQGADPRVTALHAQTIIAQQNLAVTKAQHQVTVGLIVGGGLRVHGRDDDNNIKPYYDVALQVALPILDTASYKNRVQQEKDDIQLRQLDEDQYTLTSRASDLAAALQYQSAVAGIGPATSSVASAEEAYRLREQQYQIGTTTQEQVISSFSTLVAQRVALANILAKRDLAVRQILLNEGTVNIESLDNFTPGNAANAVPTDTGAAAAAAHGGAAAPSSASAVAPPGVLPASTPTPVIPSVSTIQSDSGAGNAAASAASSTPHRR